MRTFFLWIDKSVIESINQSQEGKNIFETGEKKGTMVETKTQQ